MLNRFLVMNFWLNNGLPTEGVIRENVKPLTIFVASVLFHSSVVAGFLGFPICCWDEFIK